MHTCFDFVDEVNFWLYFIVHAKVTEQINSFLGLISLFGIPYFQSESIFSFSFFLVYASLIAQRVDITIVFLTSVGVVAGLGFF